MIDFNEYLQKCLSEEENKNFNEPDDWHTYHKLPNKDPKDGYYRVNYKSGSYKEWAKETGNIDKVREKDNAQHKAKREKLDSLYKSGISKNQNDRTEDEQHAIDLKEKSKKNKADTTKLNSDFKSFVKNTLAQLIRNNYYGSKASNSGILLKDVYKNAYKSIQKVGLTANKINELNNLPDNENEYTEKQKKLVESIKTSYDNLNSIFDNLIENGLCSSDEKESSLTNILDNTEIGNVYKKLFANKQSKVSSSSSVIKTSNDLKKEESKEKGNPEKIDTSKENKQEKEKTNINPEKKQVEKDIEKKIDFEHKPVEPKIEKKDLTDEEKEKLENERVTNNLRQYFSEDLISQLNAPFRKKVSDYIDVAPQNVKDMYKAYGKLVEIGDANYTPKPKNSSDKPAEAYFSILENKIYFNQNDKKRDTVITFFHESAHFIDANIRKLNSSSYSQIGHIIVNNYSYKTKKGNEFLTAVITDISNVILKRRDDFRLMDIDDYCEKYNIDKNSYGISIIKKALNCWQKNNLIKYGNGSEQYARITQSESNKKKFITGLLLEEIENNIKNKELQIIIADMISMSTQGGYFIGGHRKKYCKGGGYSDTTATEAFAEITQTYCSTPEIITEIEKYVPNAIKKYNELVDDINIFSKKTNP